MVCLIKEKYKTELKQYKDILGSEEAAYYVLAMNNGFTLDRTFEDKDSQLYLALLHKNNGDVKQTIIDKCVTFTPLFMEKHGDYTQGLYIGSLDNNNEPSIQDLNNSPLCDSGSISSVLQELSNISTDVSKENKKFIEILDLLEKKNFIIRDFTIQDALDYNRSVWTDFHVKEYIENNPDAKVLDIFNVLNKAKKEWNKQQIKKLMGQAQQRLASYFDLEEVKNKDGTVYYKTKDNSKKNKLRVHFVNSLREDDWKDEDGNYHKGLFKTNDGTDAAVNLILISLEDGDPTTFIHELAHHYILVFWKSDVVLKALSYLDEKELGLVRRYKKDPRPLEEKLVNAITDKVLQKDNKSWVSKFWFDFSNFVKNTLGLDLLNYNQKQNIIDQLTMYMSINQDLSYNRADDIIYDYLQGVRYSGSDLDLIDEIYVKTLNALRRKRNAIKAKILKDNSALQLIEYDIEQLESIDPSTQAFTDYMINIVAQAKRDLLILSTKLVLWSINKEDFYNISPKELVDMQTDILEYYAVLFGSQNIEITTFIEKGIQKELSDHIESIRSVLTSVAASYNARSREYVNHMIDQESDRLITTGDKQLFANNTKLWLLSQVDNGSLMFGENTIGIASQSKSPIIRLVEFLTTSQNNYVRRNTLEVGHKLYDLYKKCKFDISFNNAMRLFFELDENGDPTGYLIRPLNYGRMFKDKDKLIQGLLNSSKYKGKVELDDDGKFIFLDENIRNLFLNEKDDLEDTICNKKYIADYYKDRRKFLSQETINIQSRILRQIDILVQKHTDSVTGIPEIHKLTTSERALLNNLYKQKLNLSCPYKILYSPDGKIRSFEEKQGTDLIVAQQLMAWHQHILDKVKYLPNSSKFQEDRDYLVKKYGQNSDAVKLFDWYYSAKQISSEFYDAKRLMLLEIFGDQNLPDNIKELYQRKNSIKLAIMDKQGFYQPHLERLNDLAWAELKRIDEEIESYMENNLPEKNEDEGDDELEPISEKLLVKRYVNGKLTDLKYLLYLRDVTEENKFYEKYYYEGKGGRLKPLSIFLYEKPLDESLIQDLPIKQYSVLDIESFYANTDYDPKDPSYLQPKKELYKNDQFYEITGARRVFYNYVLQVMLEANANIPNYIDNRSYRAPGMSENSSHLLFRKSGNFIKNCWHYFKNKYSTVSDIDVDYNDEIAIKPNGERVYTIPLRWIRKLDDPADTCTDLIGSVTKYYEMALNYKVMSEFSPLVELIRTVMKGGTSASDRVNKNPDQLRRLEKYMEMYIYGRMRVGFNSDLKKMTEALKIILSMLDKIARNSVLKMMAHNIRGILKNAFDAGMSAIVETSAGKYFEKDDVIFASGICGRSVFGAIGSINTPNNINKVSAAMQYNGLSGNISLIFSGLRDSSTRRFVSRFYLMGEYSFVDYTIKGWLAPAVYHNHRLMQNFNVRAININGSKIFLTKLEALNAGLENEWQASTEYRKEFMNKQQAIYNYISSGRKGEDGENAWKKQTETAWDAFGVDEIGNFYLLPEYEDIVRPIVYSTGKRSTMTEDRIAGVMRERFAVIAGMLPYENKGEFMQNAVGLFVFMLRGWLITFYWDCFRAGNDFSTWRKKSFFDKKSTSDLANSIAEDTDFYQQMFEFETGLAGKGWHRGLGTLWKKIFMNGCRRFLNFIKNANSATKRLNTTERQQFAKFSSYLLMAIFCVIGTNIFGRLLEDDPDNLVYNFGYSESLALSPERTTQINPMAIMDLVKNATAAKSYMDDFDNIYSIPIDFAYSTYWAFNMFVGDPEFMENLDEVIKTGSYKDLYKWQRSGLKASSIIAPGLGLNNLVKNLRPEGHKAYQTWQSGLAPNSFLLDYGIMYKPLKTETKKQTNTSAIRSY